MKDIPSPVLIIGASSDIGRALAHRYAELGCAIILAGRNFIDLEQDRADLELRHNIRASVAECDVTDPDPDAFFSGLPETPGTIIMLAGLLGDQTASVANASVARRVIATNYVGPTLFLLAGARRLESRRTGCVIGVSSVAGDRGRASNFVYGSAKAGLTAFLSGLRNSLADKGVMVITVKPGFVATRMTRGMKLPRALTAQPDEVAIAVVRAQQRGTDVLYVKPVWWFIMLIIKAIPESVFKKWSL